MPNFDKNKQTTIFYFKVLIWCHLFVRFGIKCYFYYFFIKRSNLICFEIKNKVFLFTNSKTLHKYAFQKITSN